MLIEVDFEEALDAMIKRDPSNDEAIDILEKLIPLLGRSLLDEEYVKRLGAALMDALNEYEMDILRDSLLPEDD